MDRCPLHRVMHALLDQQQLQSKGGAQPLASETTTPQNLIDIVISPLQFPLKNAEASQDDQPNKKKITHQESGDVHFQTAWERK